jgi:hypothetical protein
MKRILLLFDEIFFGKKGHKRVYKIYASGYTYQCELNNSEGGRVK